MPYYAVIGFDPPHSMAKRDSVRTAHRAYVKENDQMIRLAAAMIDGQGNQSGTVYIFEAESEDQVRAWTAQEPFCSADVYKDLRIVEIMPALIKLPAMSWPG